MAARLKNYIHIKGMNKKYLATLLAANYGAESSRSFRFCTTNVIEKNC